MRFVYIFLCFFATQLKAEYIKGSDFFHGNWSGAAYTNDNTGEFDYCAVSTQYRSGYTLYFAMTKQFIFQIGIKAPNDAFRGMQSFPTTIYVDRKPRVYPIANVFGDDLAVANMPDLRVAMDQIKRGRTLWINSQFGNIPFDLTGTFKVLEKALNCADNYFEYAGRKTNGANGQNFDQSILFQLASHTVTDLGIRDFRFLSQDELSDLLPAPLNNSKVFWATPDNEIIGGVVASYEPQNSDLRSTDSQDLAYLSSICDGDVLTGALSVKEVETPMRELVTQCLDDKTISHINTTKFKAGEYVLYIVLATSKNQKKVDNASKASRDLAVKAVSYIQE